MKNIILLFFFLSSLSAFASSQSKLDDASVRLIEADLEDARLLGKKLLDLEAATLDFYYDKNRWPANKEELVSDGFYFGSFNTVYGTEINYRVVSGTARFTIDVNDELKASHIASLISATSSNDIVTKQFGRPSQSTIIQTALSKVYDGDVSRNTMDTDMYLGGNDILDVNEVRANSLRAVGGVYDEGVRVFSEKNLPTKAHVGLDKLSNFAISNSFTTSRSDYYASEKAVGDSHALLLAKIAALTKADIGLGNVQNFGVTNEYTGNSKSLYVTQYALNASHNSLNNSKLGRNEKAVNSDLLDGADSSSFARSYRKINGYALTKDITLDNSDVGLGNVKNYGITNSYSGNSATLYVSQRAINDLYDDLDDSKLDVGAKAKDSDLLDGINSSGFARSSLKINGHTLTANFDLNKSDVGLSNVQNYGVVHTYSGDSKTKYTSQFALNAAWKNLDNKIDNIEIGDADTLDGYDSSDFVKKTLKINGKPLTGNINLTKADIGLDKVSNYASTDVYTGNSRTLVVTQKALFDAFQSLSSAKLGKDEKAKDADLLDGIDSASFVQTSRTINGKNLGKNITINATDVGLSNVGNFSISDSITGSSSMTYASQKAVGDLNTALSASIDEKGSKGKYKHYVSNKKRYIVYCDSDTRYMVTSGQGSIGSSTGVEIERALPVYYDRIYSISADLVGSTKAVASEGIVHKFSIANVGNPYTTKVKLVYNNDDGVNDADAYTFTIFGRAKNNCDF